MSQPQYNTVRESANERLRPNFFHDRWYVLNNLTTWIESAVDKFANESEVVRVIDLGCGEQTYRPMFEAGGLTYHGVDLAGNERADSFFSDGAATTASEESYDVALSFSVLEHVNDPAAYLSEARRVLRRDGYLVLATHGIWLYHPDPEDYWRWTCEGLKRQIGAAGFRIIEFSGSVGLAAAGIHLVQDSLLRRISRLPWPILGRLFRLGTPLYTLFFQLAIAFADSLSNDYNRSRDAMGFFVIAQAE